MDKPEADTDFNVHLTNYDSLHPDSNPLTTIDSDGEWYSCADTSSDEDGTLDSSLSSSDEQDESSDDDIVLESQQIEDDRSYDTNNDLFEEYISGVNTTSTKIPTEEQTESSDNPVIHYSETFDEIASKPMYACKLCSHESTSVGGIKNHLNRTHKMITGEKAKDVCRKCGNRKEPLEPAYSVKGKNTTDVRKPLKPMKQIIRVEP